MDTWIRGTGVTNQAAAYAPPKLFYFIDHSFASSLRRIETTTI
jgi:hypothetical protein